MNRRRKFLEKYLAKFVKECQIRNPFVEEIQKTPIPPKINEIEDLIAFLQDRELDPIIVGTLAVIKHLKVTDEDIKNRIFRPTKVLEVLINRELPEPPIGWYKDPEDKNLAWRSPSGGFVKFIPLSVTDIGLPTDKIKKDSESVLMGCPVADIETIFLMNLNSEREKDLVELMSLTRRVGIPNLEKQVFNARQRKNLDILKLWASLRLDLSSSFSRPENNKTL